MLRFQFLGLAVRLNSGNNAVMPALGPSDQRLCRFISVNWWSSRQPLDCAHPLARLTGRSRLKKRQRTAAPKNAGAPVAVLCAPGHERSANKPSILPVTLNAVFAWLIFLVTVAPLTHAEQIGPSRRVLAADYSTRRLGIVNEKGDLEWEYPIKDIHDAVVLPNGNILFQTNWTQILEMTPSRKIVWQYDAANQNGNAGKRVEVHAFQRLDDGLVKFVNNDHCLG